MSSTSRSCGRRTPTWENRKPLAAEDGPDPRAGAAGQFAASDLSGAWPASPELEGFGQRWVIRIAADESALFGRIEEIVRAHPRHGYRMVCGRLRLGGWRVNHRRVYRLRRREGRLVQRKQRKKRRLGVSANGIDRRRATRPNDVWCWDFVEDSDHRGRPLRWLTLVDEYTRECLFAITGRLLRVSYVPVLRRCALVPPLGHDVLAVHRESRKLGDPVLRRRG